MLNNHSHIWFLGFITGINLATQGAVNGTDMTSEWALNDANTQTAIIGGREICFLIFTSLQSSVGS